MHVISKDAAPHLDGIIAVEQVAQIFPWSKQLFIDSLQAGHVCIVLLENDIVIGFAIMSVALDEAEILNIAVKPKRQRQGCGAKLMQYLLKLATDKNIKKIFLEVRASNKNAIKFYQDFGFKQIAIRKKYYATATNREDALVFSFSCYPVV